MKKRRSARAAVKADRPEHAHGTDAQIKTSNLRRLARIEGQVRGVRQMVQDERYCADILDQIAAVQNAMRSVAREVMRNHLKHCAKHAMGASDDDAKCMQEELLKLFEKRMY